MPQIQSGQVTLRRNVDRAQHRARVVGDNRIDLGQKRIHRLSGPTAHADEAADATPAPM
jgi:hypothetical protein